MDDKTRLEKIRKYELTREMTSDKLAELNVKMRDLALLIDEKGKELQYTQAMRDEYVSLYDDVTARMDALKRGEENGDAIPHIPEDPEGVVSITLSHNGGKKTNSRVVPAQVLDYLKRLPYGVEVHPLSLRSMFHLDKNLSSFVLRYAAEQQILYKKWKGCYERRVQSEQHPIPDNEERDQHDFDAPK